MDHRRQKFKHKPQKKKHLDKNEIESLIEQKKKLGNLNPLEITNFKLLPISSKTEKGLSENGFTIPTEVQCLTLVHSLQGLDVVAAAKTGSGKTMAFIIPLLEVLYCKKWNKFDGLGALIITPTRELSYQIFEVLNKVGKYHSFSAGLVIGGKDLKFEWTRVSQCNIIICTPGRLLQHMTENPEFSIENLQFLVLDEADQCLSLGFSDSMNLILQELPSDRQTLLFSATQTRNVKDLIRAGCKDPVFCSAHEHSKAVTPETLQESYLVCEDQEKITFLWSFLRHHKFHKTLVFLATCKQVKFMKDLFHLLRPGVTVMGLQGEMHQLRRMAIYDEFCTKKHAVLFATDVAARGLDIPAVDWVIQMDCPEDVNTYIHRAGRTARLSRTGECLLLLTSFQEEAMIASLKMKNIPIEKIDIDPRMQKSIQMKLEFLLSKHLDLKEKAERAFKAYLKNIAHMKNRKVFSVASIDMDAFARSLGLTVTPRARFVEKQLKAQSQKEKKSHLSMTPAATNVTKESKTFDLGVSQEDESDDDFLTRSSTQPPPPAPSSNESENVLNDLTLALTRNRKVVSKYDLARKIAKKNVQVNKKVVFDDDGDVASPGDIQVGEEDRKTGLNISEMQETLKERDAIDKQMNSQRIKEKHRKEKEKLKEDKRRREEAKREKKEQKEEEEEEEESEDESEDDAFTSELIDALPDPDKVYGGKEGEAGSSESDEESGDTDSESETKSKEKKTFKGKRRAKERAREKKRARVAADNDLDAISFQEKEDLALFLLRGKR